MNDTLPEQSTIAPAAGVAPDAVPAAAPEVAPAAAAAAAPPRRAKTRRGVRPAQATSTFPVLEQLATLYPRLFGAQFVPLKRGIFQDLMAAHQELFERDALKAALALHTRSTRYLTVVAAGRQRHDLQGQAVEDVAPEHVYQALLEVFRRRHNRAGEDVRPKLRQRILQAFDASGLSREAYAELVRGRDEAANAMLDQVLAEVSERAAKDEALLRAFEASAQSVAAFADMYGMEPQAASRALARARLSRPAAAP